MASRDMTLPKETKVSDEWDQDTFDIQFSISQPETLTAFVLLTPMTTRTVTTTHVAVIKVV